MGILSKAAAIIAPTPHKVTQYIDIFDASGKRVTSLPVTQGASVDDVLAEAKEKNTLKILQLLQKLQITGSIPATGIHTTSRQRSQRHLRNRPQKSCKQLHSRN